MDRNEFIQIGALGIFISSIPNFISAYNNTQIPNELFFNISLAEWSLHNQLFEEKINHLDFPKVAKDEFGINAVEYVNQFFLDKANDKTYLDISV